MHREIALLGKSFGIFCCMHPTEYHDSLCFEKFDCDTAMLHLNTRFDIDEYYNYFWQIPITALTEFEKFLNETGAATIEDRDNFLAMKLENGQVFYKVKIENGCDKFNCDWVKIQLKN